MSFELAFLDTKVGVCPSVGGDPWVSYKHLTEKAMQAGDVKMQKPP